MDAQTPTNGVCPVGKTPFCRLPCGENAFKVQGTPMKRHLIGGPSTKPNMLRCYRCSKFFSMHFRSVKDSFKTESSLFFSQALSVA